MATLVYCDSDGASARLELTGDVTVGSAIGCTIVVRAGELDDEHARIFEADGVYWIEVLSERGGVFVEAEPVTQRQLAIGEVAVIGSLVLRVDDSNGGGRPLIAAVELLRLLEASQRRQAELEEERNALGRRVGELHSELAAERSQPAVVVGAPRDAIAFEPVETTTPVAAGFADMEELAEKVRQSTRAIAELEHKVEASKARRSIIAKRLAAFEAEGDSGDPGELELREAERLSLEAQLAEIEKSVDSKSAKLAAREAEIVALRARLAANPRQPRRTREYSTPEADDSTKIAELKERFEEEFSRAVSFQRELKTAHQRIAELESELETREAELEELSDDRETAVEARQVLERRLRDAVAAREARGADANVAQLERKVADLDKILEAAKKEASRLRRKASDANKLAREAGEKIEELERAASDAEGRAEASAETISELETALETREKELAEARADAAELSDKLADAAAADTERAALAARVDELEAAVSKAERARDKAQAERREADVRILDAESSAREMKAKLDLAERRVGEQKAQLERLGLEIEGARGELVEAREEISRLESAANRENTQVTRLSDELDSIRRASEAELEVLEGRIVELERDLDRALDAERAALASSDVEEADVQVEIDRLSAELDKTRRELRSLDHDRVALKRVLADARARADSATAERDRLAARLQQLETEHAAATSVLRAEVDAARSSAELEIEQVREKLEIDLERARSELERTRAELKTASDRVDDLEDEQREHQADRDRAAELARELESAREQLESLGARLSEAQSGESAAADLGSRVVELASQNAQISAELVALGEAKEQVERDLATARTELEKATGELAEVRGELTDTARANSKLESANTDLTRRYEQVAEELERASIDIEALREDVGESASRAALERQCHQLRERVADLELQLAEGDLVEATENVTRPDTLADDVADELTAVAEPSPALMQWVLSLREAVVDLRRQMRTAADEAVMLEASDSTEVINVALSSAVERVETAREAIANLLEILGLD